MSYSDAGPRDITTDHETIREWVEKRGGTPAHVTGPVEDEASSLYIVREDQEMEDLEPISWNEFFETFENKNLAFVYQDEAVGETDEWLYDLIDREEVAERATLESTEVEQSLLEGDVVRSEITETKVIEKTVVETDQIESEIVDSEIIESNLLDRETINRELIGGEFTESPAHLTTTVRSEHGQERIGAEGDEVDRSDREMADTGMESEPQPDVESDTGLRPDAETEAEAEAEVESERGESGVKPVSEPVDEVTSEPATDRQSADEPTTGLEIGDAVVLDVHDTVQTTTEIFDRKTVESRVVEQEITEADEIESDEIDILGVEESILESDLIEGEIVSDETTEGETVETETRTQTGSLPSGAITSERTEGDTVHSQFVERRLVETESTEHHQVTCDITDHKLVDTIDSRSTVIERAIVDREAGEEAMLRQPEEGVKTTDQQITAAEETTTTPVADAEMAGQPEGDTGESGTVTGVTTVSDDEIGKRVVSGDEEVGMVTNVDDQTLYVDPDPSLTDRIKAALDWGDTDEESYPVDREQIESIDDEEVRIREI